MLPAHPPTTRVMSYSNTRIILLGALLTLLFGGIGHLFYHLELEQMVTQINPITIGIDAAEPKSRLVENFQDNQKSLPDPQHQRGDNPHALLQLSVQELEMYGGIEKSRVGEDDAGVKTVPFHHSVSLTSAKNDNLPLGERKTSIHGQRTEKTPPESDRKEMSIEQQNQQLPVRERISGDQALKEAPTISYETNDADALKKVIASDDTQASNNSPHRLAMNKLLEGKDLLGSDMKKQYSSNSNIDSSDDTDKAKTRFDEFHVYIKQTVKKFFFESHQGVRLVGDSKNKGDLDHSNIPKSEFIFHNKTALRGTFKNVCMEDNRILFFGWMPEQRWLWDTFTYLGVWVRMGTPKEWKNAIHVKGPSVTLIADTPGNNNLHHLWYGKHFPTITRVMQAKETGDTPPYFENIIRDGSIVNMGPIDFNLGSIGLIIKLLQNFNIQNNLPPMKDYIANSKQIVCAETLAVQGTKEDLIRSAMMDIDLAKKIIQDYRTLAYEQAGIAAPTPNRCPKNALVFAKFDSNHKRWLNAKDFYQAFKATHPHMHVEYWDVVDGKMGFEEQIRYFSNIDLFICPNGSHQQVALFMAHGATVVETLDEGYFAPSWNIDFSMNYLVGIHGFQIRGRLATEVEYEASMADYAPQDVKSHKNMSMSYLVEVDQAVHIIDKHIHHIGKYCTNDNPRKH